MIKISGHEFELMSDMGVAKEYLCSKCRAKATLNIRIPEDFNMYVKGKEKKGLYGSCAKEKLVYAYR